MIVPDRQKLLHRLQKLSEKSLTERIIIPLFRKMDFDSIELRHGPYEKGVDILCFKKDELDRRELVAVQVKKLRFSGNAAEIGHLHNVLTQLGQCLEEPVKLKDGTAAIASRAWLLSPFNLDASALEASFAKYSKANVNRLRVIDGDTVLDLLDKKAPEILAELGNRYAAYLKQVQSELSFLQEASAFQIRDKVSLLPIYIHLDISVLPLRLQAMITGDIEPSKIQNTTLEEEISKWSKISDHAGYLASRVNRWTDFGDKSQAVLRLNPVVVINDESQQSSDDQRAAQWKRRMMVAVVAVDWPRFYRRVRTVASEKIAKLKQPHVGDDLVSFHQFVNSVDHVINHPIPTATLGLKPRSHVRDPDRISIKIETLLESRLNCQITGDAGAGKTTLLRMLGHKEALNKTGRIPIFIPLTTLSAKRSLVTLVQQSCKNHSLAASQKSFDQLLQSGRLLLLLDGIDEAASRVDAINAEIGQFMTEYENTQCVFTARPWAAMNRNARFLNLQILPFTPEQVRTFFSLWFKDDESHTREIIDHLEANPYLYHVIATPLVATIFAVVKLFGYGLPTSLLEVYERRFQLLLHNWDAAKGVRRDSFSSRDKLFFLRKLGFYLHSETIRSVPWDTVVRLIIQTLGEVKTWDEADKFARELVQNNNVLVQHEDGNWGLGHLQYQEYLAALEAKDNPRIDLAQYIDRGWWASVLRMHAELARDITNLILGTYLKYGSKTQGLTEREDLLHQLNTLVSLAPNTEKQARGLVERDLDLLTAVQMSFARYSDDEVLEGKGKPRAKRLRTH